MEPLISLCIASYNNALYLDRMIQSAIHQTYKNLEILIVDDGSTDNTSKVINKYINVKKIIYIQKENGGLSSSRQLALENAKGKYICFVDADDYLSKDYISHLYKCIKKHDSDICVCGTKFIDENGNELQKETKEYSIIKSESSELNYSDINNKYSFLTSKYLMSDSWNKMYKLEFIKNNNITFNMPKGLNGTDLIFNHKVLLYCPKFCTLPSFEYFHVIYSSSAAHRFNKKLLLSYQTTIEELLIKSKEIPSIDFYGQIKILYLNFTRNSLFDIYLDYRQLKTKNCNELYTAFNKCCNYYENNFLHINNNISKSLKIFEYILLKKKKRLLIIYFYIRRLLLFR